MNTANISCPAMLLQIGSTTEVSPFISLNSENKDLATEPKETSAISETLPPEMKPLPTRLVKTIAQA